MQNVALFYIFKLSLAPGNSLFLVKDIDGISVTLWWRDATTGSRGEEDNPHGPQTLETDPRWG